MWCPQLPCSAPVPPLRPYCSEPGRQPRTNTPCQGPPLPSGGAKNQNKTHWEQWFLRKRNHCQQFLRCPLVSPRVQRPCLWTQTHRGKGRSEIRGPSRKIDATQRVLSPRLFHNPWGFPFDPLIVLIQLRDVKWPVGSVSRTSSANYCVILGSSCKPGASVSSSVKCKQWYNLIHWAIVKL